VTYIDCNRTSSTAMTSAMVTTPSASTMAMMTFRDVIPGLDQLCPQCYGQDIQYDSHGNPFVCPVCQGTGHVLTDFGVRFWSWLWRLYHAEYPDDVPDGYAMPDMPWAKRKTANARGVGS
jgi:hypothetical protein